MFLLLYANVTISDRFINLINKAEQDGIESDYIKEATFKEIKVEPSSKTI